MLGYYNYTVWLTYLSLASASVGIVFSLITGNPFIGIIALLICGLCDGFDGVAEIYYGRSFADAPDVDGKVYFKSRKKLNPGDFVTVRVDEALDYDLVGEAL